MDVISNGIRDPAPWCMLFADDIVICCTNRFNVEMKLEQWRRALEDRGLKISRKKTEYLSFCDESAGVVRMQREEVKIVENFTLFFFGTPRTKISSERFV